MLEADRLGKKPIDPEFQHYIAGLDLGSVFHIFHITYNLKSGPLEVKKKKREENETEEEIQRKFRDEFGLIVDKPRQDS